jgi:hypothetical protein
VSSLITGRTMSIRDRIFSFLKIAPLTLLASTICGGLGGAIFTQVWTSRPADVQAQLGDYAFAMGKPLLGILIVLPNYGFRPGTVTSIELTITAKGKTGTGFESVFVSRQSENLRILPSGKVEVTGDAQLSLFSPITVSAGQTVSALVWFQPKKEPTQVGIYSSPPKFAFDPATYECEGKLSVWSGSKLQMAQLLPFRFTLEQYEADAMNQKDQKNVLLPIRIQRVSP